MKAPPQHSVFLFPRSAARFLCQISGIYIALNAIFDGLYEYVSASVCSGNRCTQQDDLITVVQFRAADLVCVIIRGGCSDGQIAFLKSADCTVSIRIDPAPPATFSTSISLILLSSAIVLSSSIIRLFSAIFLIGYPDVLLRILCFVVHLYCSDDGTCCKEGDHVR